MSRHLNRASISDSASAKARARANTSTSTSTIEKLFASVPTNSKELVLELELAIGKDYLVHCPHHLKRARASTSTSARERDSTSTREQGKIAKYLHPHCLRVHKVQTIFLPASRV